MEAENHWIMCFDTETTGIGPDYKGVKYADKQTLLSDLAKGVHWDKNVAHWIASETYIAQLSYCVFNTETNEMKKFNKYISDIPADVVMSKKENPQTHPIIKATLEAAERASPEDKATLMDSLQEFYVDFMRSSVVVAHNADFDQRMVFFELYRRFRESQVARQIYTNIKKNIGKYLCTMCMYKDIVKINTKIVAASSVRIPYTEKTYVDRALVERKSIKVPALWEVYDKLFGYPPDASALHDSMIDVVVLLRVFYRYWMVLSKPTAKLCGRGDPDIYGKNAEIDEYINKITPYGIEPSGNFENDELQNCYGELDASGIPKEPYSRINGNPVKTRRYKERKGKSASLKRRSGTRSNKPRPRSR
jgi:DNA polymerase III epsilon subunit-like protein